MAKETQAMRSRWVVGGLGAVSARYIPLPLIDDYVAKKARKYVIETTLRAHGRTFPSSDVSVLYEQDKGGTFGRVLKRTVAKILLYPIRKPLRIARSFRGVPLDLMHTFLLGRAVDRCLDAGMLAEDLATEERMAQATRISEGFEAALQGLDHFALATLLKATAQFSERWRPQLAQWLRNLRQEPETNVEKGSLRYKKRLEEVWRNEEARSVLLQFDTRFDPLVGIQ